MRNDRKKVTKNTPRAVRGPRRHPQPHRRGRPTGDRSPVRRPSADRAVREERGVDDVAVGERERPLARPRALGEGAGVRGPVRGDVLARAVGLARAEVADVAAAAPDALRAAALDDAARVLAAVAVAVRGGGRRFAEPAEPREALRGGRLAALGACAVASCGDEARAQLVDEAEVDCDDGGDVAPGDCDTLVPAGIPIDGTSSLFSFSARSPGNKKMMKMQNYLII